MKRFVSIVVWLIGGFIAGLYLSPLEGLVALLALWLGPQFVRKHPSS